MTEPTIGPKLQSLIDRSAPRTKAAILALEGPHKEIEAAFLEELEQRARKIMKRHPACTEFVMAMGGAQFDRRDGHAIDDTDYAGGDCPQYLEDFFEWLGDMNALHGLGPVMGIPIRFTADGPVVTNW